jgi:hypothetical protein
MVPDGSCVELEIIPLGILVKLAYGNVPVWDPVNDPVNGAVNDVN